MACFSLQHTAHTSVAALVRELGWTELRSQTILVGGASRQHASACAEARLTLSLLPHPLPQEQLVREGMAWVDDQDEGGGRLYWFPGLFTS